MSVDDGFDKGEAESMSVRASSLTSEQDGHGVQWVGDHIRPRVRVPDSWH